LKKPILDPCSSSLFNGSDAPYHRTMSFKNYSRISVARLSQTGLLIFVCFALLSGCATSRASREVSAAKVSRLEGKLRRAKARIETLRERNWVLKNRIKIIEANEGVDPAVTPGPLAAFPEGLELDVPISPSRVDASMVRRGKKSARRPIEAPAIASMAEAPKVIGESADRVLSRTVSELLRAGDEAEALRTALLLEKSYPESPLVAEARFQQGLYHYRKNNSVAADRYFRSTLSAPKAHIRARAGAALLRGVIARKASNFEAAKKNFSYVTSNFPKSPEAARARREARVLKRLEAGAIVRKK